MSENVTAHQFNSVSNTTADAAVLDAAPDVMDSMTYSTADDARSTTSSNPDNAGYVRSNEVAERAQGRLGYRIVKRAFDIVFSTVVIALLLIPSVFLCLAIRLESPGCPIYCQRRVGRISKNGEVKTFPMFKFRSMYKDADERLAELQHMNEADGPLFKIKDDPRVTGIGRFIRKHSIDELPQFLNCLIGQLSTVGPRPPLPHEVEQYDARAMNRLSIKPGITGYWQVSGRSNTTFDDMVDMDLKYIKKRSIIVDLKLVCRTVGVMLTGKGAF